MKFISILTLLLSAALLPAQAQNSRYVTTTGDLSLSGAGSTLTIQQPASGSKNVYLEAAVVYCSVACNLTQAQNGTAATTTAGTAVAINPVGPTAAAKVFTASNVGAGTSLAVFHLAAGDKITFDLTKIALAKGTSTATNYSLLLSSITGTANITLYWSER